MPNFNFYLSLISFLASIGAGVYFLAQWLVSKKHDFLLWWALGFLSLLWFKIPNILANAGQNIIQTDFYPFFYITLLLYLASYIAFARGLSHFTQFLNGKFIVEFFLTLFCAAAVYFYLTFFIKGLDVSYAPVWIGHLLFYIPIQLFIFNKLRHMRKALRDSRGPLRTGNTFSSMGVLALLLSSFLYIIVQVYPYTHLFWYLAVINSSSISLVQIIAIVLLFFGFRAFLLGSTQTKTN